MTEINPLIGKERLKKRTPPMIDPITEMGVKKGKVVTADAAVALIREGDTLVTAGFVGAGFAEELAIALKERFLNAKKVCFMGMFTADGLNLFVEDGKLRIDRDGRQKKFVRAVEQKTFSGRWAADNRQPVLYITERCVFALCAEGLELIEIAPGIDLETQILALMDFAPIMRRPPRLMDERIFRIGRMGIKEAL